MKCKMPKERWLNDKCEEIEKEPEKNNMWYQRIDEITGRKSGCARAGCIKSKEGKMLV